ncbi:MAG: phosphoenolpyruvate--protein phosphotransferase [Candidatus Omnitrophica bacterium]|nr:phosphoenolpyruvate--protein phosphotransferase [Candidatus Omnitrophota bacterium]
MSEILRLEGIAASPGIIIGPAFKLRREEWIIRKQKISEAEIPMQIQLFEEALIKTRHEILDLQKRISEDMGKDSAQIFEAHLLVLEDRMLIEEVISRLKTENLTVAYIFQEVLKKYIAVFSRIEDDYLRERVSDINDVGKRILRHLLGKEGRGNLLANLEKRVILVAHDLSPSETAIMHKENICGFVTDVGGKTSHTAIMAKSIEIPAVVGLRQATEMIKNDDLLIVDGSLGLVIVNPDEAMLNSYHQEEDKLKGITQKFSLVKDLPALTPDNYKVTILANIELPEEIPSVKLHGAEGIGLYRTEYFYMNRKDLPSEEEQFVAYSSVAESFSPHPVTIRTLDLGGDKFISQLEIPREMTSFLGWRAIRFCLARPDIFKVQLRAILRASVFGQLRLMYPMISGIGELEQANKILEDCKNELNAEDIPFNKDIKVGTMIELPSAALTADLLARKSDFFSIGTNDLIQYSLAVDRANEKVAYLYEPTHPAVLRMIKNVIEAGHDNNIEVAMCGEMAGDEIMILILLGMGLDVFSVPSLAIPQIKYIIRSVTMEEARQIAHQALTLSTGKEVELYSQNRLRELLK